MADWDARLITPGRALELAGDWELTATYELAELSQFEGEGGAPGQADRLQVNLRCAVCSQSIADMGDGTGRVQIAVEGVLSAMLRHLVMAHDMPLSGAGKAASNGRR
jgi:hypothetical protein